MKTLLLTNVKALTATLTSKKSKNQNSSFDFSKPGFSRDQMAAVKGGEDTSTDIVIRDIIGG